jgi:multicomponent Na+:H+ antiporter subunit D
LFLLAFGIKAAAFPVNAWLPASYHTPSPAISALFGSLLTKVGVYALLRTLVVLMPGTHPFLSSFIAAIAILTLVLAPMGAIAETNLRRAVGFMVIGGIGAIIAGLALPSVQGLAGAIMYVLHAMLSLTALYLVAGLIEKLTGTNDTRQMGGVYAANSLVSILFLVLILAVSGVPPFLGFWPKLLLLSAGSDFAGLVAKGGVVDYGALALVLALLLNAILTLIAGSRLWAHIFWRAGPEGALSERANDKLRPLSRREAGFGLVATSVLVAIVFIAGLWPNLLFEVGHIAASDLVNPQRYIAAVGLGGAP